MIVHGYLIDPEKKTITRAKHDTKDYKEIYSIIGCEPSPFTVVHIDRHDVIFVDDEGLFKDPRHFFNLRGYPQPIAGKGLVLGTGPEGDTVSARISLKELKRLVSYSEHKVLGMNTTEETGTVMGDDKGFIIKVTPVFGPVED